MQREWGFQTLDFSMRRDSTSVGHEYTRRKEDLPRGEGFTPYAKECKEQEVVWARQASLCSEGTGKRQACPEEGVASQKASPSRPATPNTKATVSLCFGKSHFRLFPCPLCLRENSPFPIPTPPTMLIRLGDTRAGLFGEADFIGHFGRSKPSRTSLLPL